MNVTHRGGILRLMSLASRGRFVAIHNDGNLVMYDGDSGAPLTSMLVSSELLPVLFYYICQIKNLSVRQSRNCG